MNLLISSLVFTIRVLPKSYCDDEFVNAEVLALELEDDVTYPSTLKADDGANATAGDPLGALKSPVKRQT